ncbi:MAG: type III pantothenate kinase [Muribaculaceae bacterium]|nr:type III pantothenate kinase [Muribaculaceae bacterium]
MGLSLTIDQGNTRAKVVVWDGNTPVYENGYESLSPDDLRSLLAQYPVDKAIAASVAVPVDALSQFLADEIGIRLIELRPGMAPPLKVDYATPETLGVDRLAAAVGAAALHPGKELLVVDAGTAVTYDRVTARGHYVGGNIAPGVGMRLRALNNYTARLPLINSYGETRLWGNTTETALRSGAINGVVAEIAYYRSRLPLGAVTVITGGWGREIASKLDFETDYQELLVNCGLNSILNYHQLILSILSQNENKQTNR